MILAPHMHAMEMVVNKKAPEDNVARANKPIPLMHVRIHPLTSLSSTMLAKCYLAQTQPQHAAFTNGISAAVTLLKICF